MAKSLLAGSVEKTLPVIGGVLGGAITYAPFKPCCDKLKDLLSDTLLSNSKNSSQLNEDDVIDIDFTEIETVE